jgi:hypothetical protein
VKKYRKGIPRRTLCELVGRRAQTLRDHEAVVAWQVVGKTLEEWRHRDMPKFADLLGLIRGATLAAKKACR